MPAETVPETTCIYTATTARPGVTLGYAPCFHPRTEPGGSERAPHQFRGCPRVYRRPLRKAPTVPGSPSSSTTPASETACATPDSIVSGGRCASCLRPSTASRPRGIHLVSIEERLDTSSVAGEFMFHVFGAIAHFEARLISERTRDGIAAARKRGGKPGRPPLDPETVLAARKLMEAGLSPAPAAKQLGFGRATAYRIAAELRERLSAPLT